jgi:hypothetical protein
MVLGAGHLFPWGSEKGNWRGASLLGILNNVKRALEMNIFLYVGAP